MKFHITNIMVTVYLTPQNMAAFPTFHQRRPFKATGGIDAANVAGG
jgi:hypothetical protein